MNIVEPPELLTEDEVNAIVVAVARYEAGPDATEPYPVPDMDRLTRVAEWANEVRVMESTLNLVLDGRLLVDYDTEQEDIVFRVATA